MLLPWLRISVIKHFKLSGTHSSYSRSSSMGLVPIINHTLLEKTIFLSISLAKLGTEHDSDWASWASPPLDFLPLLLANANGVHFLRS